jgi:hypothetical protein
MPETGSRTTLLWEANWPSPILEGPVLQNFAGVEFEEHLWICYAGLIQ